MTRGAIFSLAAVMTGLHVARHGIPPFVLGDIVALFLVLALLWWCLSPSKKA